jgi:hypothetical protein
MSLLFADSFDHYRSVGGGRYAVDGKWSRPSTVALIPGQRGSLGLGLRDTGAAGGGFFPSIVRKNFLPQTELVIACACFIGSESNSRLDSNAAIGEMGGGGFGFMVGTDDYLYIRLGLTSDGGFIVSRSAYPQNSRDDGGGSYVGSGLRVRLWESDPNVFAFGQWNTLEFKVSASYSTGAFEVRLNGVSLVEETGVRTVPYNQAETIAADNLGTINPQSFTQVAIASLGNDSGSVVDDFYVLNTQGTRNNDFLGRVQVDLLLPDGDGLREDSTIGGTSPAASRWEGARSPDQGVTYNEFAATDDSDSYTFDDLPYEEADVFAVQIVAQARRDDQGQARITLTNDVDGSDVDASPTLLTPSAGDTYAFVEAHLDESAAGEWTLDRVNDSEFGVRRSALP